MGSRMKKHDKKPLSFREIAEKRRNKIKRKKARRTQKEVPFLSFFNALGLSLESPENAPKSSE